ncbi:FAD-dependent oxidoreductase [Streptomyces thermocarboxydus]
MSAALHLLGAGRRVTVVERDELPGGRAGRKGWTGTGSTPDPPC